MESEGPSGRNKNRNRRKNKSKLRLFRGKLLRRRELRELLFRSQWPWGVAFTLVVTGLLSPRFSFQPVQYRLGDIAPVDIRAPYGFSYEDEVTTEARREEAAEAVEDVYAFHSQASIQARARIGAAFALGRQRLAEAKEPAGAARDQLFLEVRDALDVQLSEAEFALLLKEQFREELERGLATAVGSVLERDLVASKERLEATGKPIRRRDETTQESVVIRDFSSTLTIQDAQRLLRDTITQIPKLGPAARRRLAELGARFIEPTLTFDFVETEKQRQAARNAVEPVYFQVRKGKVIVRAGDEIDENVRRQLDILYAAEGKRWRLAKVVGALLLAGLLMLSLWKLMRPARQGLPWRRNSYVLCGVIVIVHLALARVVFFVAGALAGQLLTAPLNNETSYYYIVPYAAVGILVRLLENRPSAMLASVVFSVLLGLMSGNLYLAVFCLLSCLGAILGYLQYKQRTALIKAGLFVGSINSFIVLGIDLLTERFSPGLTFGFDLLCAFVGGTGVSVVLSVLLPGFESLFHRTTDIKLLELSNHNIPVLRRLTIEAPGTYHHSVVVGSLAEAAAEAIGANAIFCRTAALYHDIGKIKKVDYFVENQVGPNRHDKLAPRMSALIVASHVKEGIELAKEMDLPQDIVDIIPQHHGTKLITYFYEKAKECQDPSLGEVSEDEYRYPGPKPQTKEAGIIMIADGVEAASRTLEDPSPARLKGVIRQIIDRIFLDGQLDECDLTLRDLEKISQAFLRVLVGMHHHRVDYPGFDFGKKVEPVVVQDQGEKEKAREPGLERREKRHVAVAEGLGGKEKSQVP